MVSFKRDVCGGTDAVECDPETTRQDVLVER